MATIKKTYKEAQALKNLIAYGIDGSVNDKLTYAAKKVLKNIDAGCKSITESLNDQVADLHVSNALTDKVTGALLTKEGAKGESYIYSADGKMKLNNEIKAAYKAAESLEVEFEPFFSQDCPRIKAIDLDVLEELSGILFSEDLVDSILNPA